MGFYNSPKQPNQLLQKGVPAYLLGGLNMLRGNTSGTVADVALASNVGTVTVQINQGQIPLVGDLITIWGTVTLSGLFNVTRALITAVTFNTATNAGTISYALTGANTGITADTGMFLVEVGETYSTLTTSTFSEPVVVQAPQCDSQFTIPLAVTFQTIPTAATVTLQKAIRDINAEYTNTTTAVVVAGSAYTSGPVVEATLERGYLYRVAVTGVTGGTGICAKVG